MSIERWLAAAWIAGLLGVAAFVAAYGAPWWYRDRALGWHLFWSAVAAALTYLGLLLAWWSLVPLLVAEWLGVGIVYWRVGLLIATRRSTSGERKHDHE